VWGGGAFFEAGTKFLNVIYMNLVLQRVKRITVAELDRSKMEESVDPFNV
jgi:hypothetical protein